MIFDAWPTEFRVITQGYGARPQYYAQFGLPGHEGVDLRARQGTKVFSVWPGVVKLAVTDNGKHPYGTHVRIIHFDGEYETIYAHLHNLEVKAGLTVAAGDLIGLAGSTGNSTAAHLHLTLKRNGQIVDPTPYLPKGYVIL